MEKASGGRQQETPELEERVAGTHLGMRPLLRMRMLVGVYAAGAGTDGGVIDTLGVRETGQQPVEPLVEVMLGVEPGGRTTRGLQLGAEMVRSFVAQRMGPKEICALIP